MQAKLKLTTILIHACAAGTVSLLGCTPTEQQPVAAPPPPASAPATAAPATAAAPTAAPTAAAPATLKPSKVVADAGHALFMEKPQTFNQTVEAFLNEPW